MDPDTQPVELTPEATRLICHRNFGIGSDGILLRTESARADFGVRILNPDGSEAEKSGNGIRIFAKFLREHGYATADRFSIRTAGGIVRVALQIIDGRVREVTADMGKATFGAVDGIDVDGRRIAVTSVSLGNPHCVVVVPSLDALDVPRLGPKIERHPVFPQRTNVQPALTKRRTASPPPQSAHAAGDAGTDIG